MNNLKFKNFLIHRKQHCRKKESLTDILYAYFKENIISTSLVIINILGIILFLIYFIHIEYLPDLDFAGVMYLLVAIATLGFLYLAYFSIALFLPSVLWDGMLPDNYQKNKIHIILNYIFYLLILLILFYQIDTEFLKLPKSLLLILFLATFLTPILYYILLIGVKKYLKYTESSRFKDLIKKEFLIIKNNKDYFSIWYVFSMQNFIILFLSLILLASQKKFDWSSLLLVVLIPNVIYLLVNLFASQISKMLLLLISPVIIFCILLFMGQEILISAMAIKTFHIGNFNATVVFKNDYCEVLKTYKIPVFNENKTFCSANIDNVLWRVGKESLLNVADKNITVPSDQIISMTWPIIPFTLDKSVESNITVLPIISFEFNSTNLTKKGKQELVNQIEVLDNNKTKEITIYGCASPDGTKRYNKYLSLKRAEYIKTWIDGYLAKNTQDIKIHVVGEGTSNNCTDVVLEKELQSHRKVIIK